MRLTLHKREYVVVSVGGSLIVPDEIDLSFLRTFRELILRKLNQGLSFYIVTGGGKLARRYQDVANELTPHVEQDELDWLGIQATRINAQLMKSLFPGKVEDRFIKNPKRRIPVRAPLIVASGWKPGWSTDYCSVMAAKQLGAKKVVNFSNIDYVYTADPRTNPDAKKLEKISWKEFRELIPKEWRPGLSSPFDPVAAKEAEAAGIEVAIINGTKLEEFDNYLSGKPFVGTLIS